MVQKKVLNSNNMVPFYGVSKLVEQLLDMIVGTFKF